MTMIEAERPQQGLLYHREDSSAEEEYETTVEDIDLDSTEEVVDDVEGFAHFRSLNNYLNNLNVAFNSFSINTRFNAFVHESPLWKLYENSPPFPQMPLPKPFKPRIEAIANLWKQLSDEESVSYVKRQEYEEVRRKANQELQRRLGHKVRPRDSPTHNNKLDKNGRRDAAKIGTPPQIQDTQETLNKEFWAQFLGFTTDTDESKNWGESVDRTPPINPFYSRVYMSTYDKIKFGVMIIPAVVRALFTVIFLSIALLFMLIGTCGITPEKMLAGPLSTWRRVMRWITANVIMRLAFFSIGFWRINTIGRQATQKEAPVLAVAPHSSFFDAFIVPFVGGPSVVAKAEASKYPIFGKLMLFTQAIFVDRNSSDSRQACKNEIKRRVNDGQDWPQVIIFPEGTCTNRSAMIQFRTGAFEPGVPIQPIVVRYPNRLDCITWTFDGPAAWWTLILSLTQFYNSLEIEYLPVYVPNDEEKANAILFAKNVQTVMAEALGVPNTEFSFEDGAVLGRLLDSKIREKFRRIWKIKGDLKLREAPTETTLVYERTTSENPIWRTTLPQFQDLFNPDGNTEAIEEIAGLFELFQPDSDNTIDLRSYLILVCFLYYGSQPSQMELLERLIFKMHTGNRRTISEQQFVGCMEAIFESSANEARKVFQKGRAGPDMSFEEFQEKIHRRVEYLKLYAMESTGQISGNYPRRNARDQRPNFEKRD